MSKQRMAVIGLGEIAKVHLASIAQTPNAQLAAACDTDESKKERVPGVPFYTDYKEMLAKEELDCVHICLPHYLHYPVSKAAAEAGVNVFCEKPLAINAEEAREFAALEAKYPDLRLGICLQNRRNESFEELMRILGSGEAGKVTGLSASVFWARAQGYYQEAPWRGTMKEAGGGVMINQSIHTLDLMQLIGGKIESVQGSVSRLLDYGIEVEDTASARIAFAGGVTGFFSATVANFRNDGVVISVTTEKEEYQIASNALYRVSGGARELLVEDAKMPGAKFYYGASHTKLIRQFYNSLEKGTREFVPISEGVVSMQMIDAINESSRTGKAVQF